MEGIDFIPKGNNQARFTGRLEESKPVGVGSYFVVFLVLGIFFVASIYALKYFMLTKKMERLVVDIADIKAQYSVLLPEKMELGMFLASINDLLEDRRLFSNLFSQLNSRFLPELTVSSVKYIKENKVIEISAQIGDVNLIVKQLNQIRELDFVANADFSRVKTEDQGLVVSFLIIVSLI